MLLLLSYLTLNCVDSDFWLYLFYYVFRLKFSESVQYFSFDKEGNMFVYPPGAGCTGIPRKFYPGDELDLTNYHDVCEDQNVSCSAPPSISWNHIPTVDASQIHRLVPQKGKVELSATR